MCIRFLPMKIALLTPQFAPNLYDLTSMLKADRVIFTDVEKWSRKGRTHRAEIRSEQGTQWINLPILGEDRKKAIREVRLDSQQRWYKEFWNTLSYNYQNATYFDYFADELHADILKVNDFEYLLDFNVYFFKRMLRFLEMEINFELASETEGYSTFPDECARNLGADVFYIEHQSKNYQRQSELAEIALTKHPNYRQSYPGFKPNCSVLDLLLNQGVESFKVMDALS